MTLRIALIDAVKEQVGQDSALKATLTDVTTHGADVGFSGFTYHKDTIAFFNENRDDILEAAKDFYYDQSIGLLEGLASMPYLKQYNVSIDEVAEVIYSTESSQELDSQIRNAMSWFALEAVAQHCVYNDDFRSFEKEDDE